MQYSGHRPLTPHNLSRCVAAPFLRSLRNGCIDVGLDSLRKYVALFCIAGIPPVGGAVSQLLVLRAEHTVIVFVIHILLPLVSNLHGMRWLVDGLHLGKGFGDTMIHLIKHHAVVYISGSNYGLRTNSCLSRAHTQTAASALPLHIIHFPDRFRSG